MIYGILKGTIMDGIIRGHLLHKGGKLVEFDHKNDAAREARRQFYSDPKRRLAYSGVVKGMAWEVVALAS